MGQTSLRITFVSEGLQSAIRYPVLTVVESTSWAGALVLKIAYGFDTKPGHDPLVEIVDEAMAQFADLVRPGAWLVDFIPLLRFIPAWFPGGKFKAVAKHYRKTLDDMIDIPFRMVQAQMVFSNALYSSLGSTN